VSSRALGPLALTVGLVLLALGPAPGFAQTPEPRASLPDIEDEVMCPVCGTTLELAESAPQAERERELIRRLIAQGRTKEQIVDELVAEYGEDVLAVPESEGFDVTNWLVPVAGIAIALGALAFGAASLRRRRAGAAPEPLSRPESDRLDADLKRYDL
jgi:cytochrome c-type biogenesis protein CcmH